MTPPPFVVVSDFDGTITDEDLVVALTTFVDPTNVERVRQINQRQLALKPGLAQLFSTLPTNRRDEYEAFCAQTGRIRTGYHAFRHALATQGIPFYLVSNGLDFIIDAVLGPPTAGESRITNRAIFDTSVITIDWRYPCEPPCPGGCGLCKHRVIRELKSHYQAPVVLIGDGITDWNGAQVADRVYARSRLSEMMKAQHLPYRPFESFDEVWQDLSEVLTHPEILQGR
mgnify:CR=1 FL=1